MNNLEGSMNNNVAWVSMLVVLLSPLATEGAAAVVIGRVSYQGAAPAPESLPVQSQHQAACGRTSVSSEELLVGGDGGLQNVVVTLVGAEGTASPRADVEIDQEGCVYSPHVQAVPAGSTVTLVNSDDVLHNVHTYRGTNTVFNIAMPIQGQRIQRQFDEPGVVSVKCDVHSWMSAYVVVTDSEFHTVSDDAGAFTLEGVPAGTYTLRAWHESLGTVEQQVTVPDSGEVKVTFTFP